MYNNCKHDFRAWIKNVSSLYAFFGNINQIDSAFLDPFTESLGQSPSKGRKTGLPHDRKNWPTVLNQQKFYIFQFSTIRKIYD